MSQNVSDLGRAKFQNPELLYDTQDGGTALYARLTAMHKAAADHLTARFTDSVTLANSASTTVTHNFGLTTISELEVLIWESGAVISKTKIATSAGSGVEYVIAATNSNVMTIQNVSGGSKTFFALVFAHRFLTSELSEALSMIIQADSASTGTGAALAAPVRPILRVSNASLVSVSTIPAGRQGQPLKLVNATGVAVLINNETGSTAADRILTGTGGVISLQANASLDLIYDSVSSRWRIVGGAGGGGFSEVSTVTVSSGGTISLGSGQLQVIPVAGNSAAVTASTTPFGSTPPLGGTVIRLVGTSNANNVTIPHNDASNGCLLSGDALLGRGATLDVQYVTALSRYVEVARNNILGV
jgi:hypothetical protein